MIPILFMMLNSMSGYWSWDAMVSLCWVCFCDGNSENRVLGVR
jgi:hypothetical protein